MFEFKNRFSTKEKLPGIGLVSSYVDAYVCYIFIFI